jgi:hypothetical protein
MHSKIALFANFRPNLHPERAKLRGGYMAFQVYSGRRKSIGAGAKLSGLWENALARRGERSALLQKMGRLGQKEIPPPKAPTHFLAAATSAPSWRDQVVRLQP